VCVPVLRFSSPERPLPSPPPGLAFAEPTAPGADMSVNVPGPKIGVKSTGKTVRIDITNRGPDPASNAKVVIQIADVSDSVDVLLPGFAGCTD
jgi:FtsP/CotA-like multicopper oxidase with cupredoxin domain